jgi:exopolysaccharide production protein ExoZ
MNAPNVELYNHTNKIISLQFLRAFAAWAVVFHHYCQVIFSWNTSQSLLGEHLGFFFSRYGKLGVDIFFVISGFIIYLSLYKSPNAPQFLWHRIIRIYPPYWCFTFLLVALSFFISIFLSEWNAQSLALSMLLIPHDNPSDILGIYPFLTVGWTLIFEMTFYLLCATSVFLFKKNWASIVVPLLGLSTTFWQPSWYGAFFFCSPYIIEFALGLIIGILYTKNVFAKVNKLSTLVIASSAIYLFWLGGGEQYKYIAISLLIAAFLCINQNAFRGKIAAISMRLGDISYSTYLAHAIVINLLLAIFGTMPNKFDELILLFTYIFLTYFLSELSYRYIENSSWNKKLKTRFFKRVKDCDHPTNTASN